MLNGLTKAWLRAWRGCGRGLAACCVLAGCTDIGAELSDSARTADTAVPRIVDGDPQQGRALIAAIGCGACHSIPGVRGAHGIVGPPLAGFARRQLIGGVVPNQPGTLVRWIRDAPSIAPNTGMPKSPLSAEQAKDVAAYLYTLR